jgi:hypothetical protein
MIFATTQRKAEEKLNELATKLDGDIVYRTKDIIKTKDKTIKARRWSENCRGYRFKEVYVDSFIDHRCVDECILPYLMSPAHWNGDWDEEQKWNWREHVHYF